MRQCRRDTVGMCHIAVSVAVAAVESRMGKNRGVRRFGSYIGRKGIEVRGGLS
jgi:hypothetical protein